MSLSAGLITGSNPMRKRFIALGVLSAVIAGIINLPLRWVAPHVMPDGLGQNLTYIGTVWNGQVSGLDYIQTANFTLNPKALVSGGLPLAFQTRSNAMAVSGQASQSRLNDIRFTGTLAKLPTRDGRLKELAGQVNISLSDMQIEDNNCRSAQGQVSTDFLRLNRARWQWQGPELKGPISCEDGELVVNLLGKDNNQNIRADLRLFKDGRYAANFTVQTSQPEAGVVLPLYGFELVGRDYKLTEQGQWR